MKFEEVERIEAALGLRLPDAYKSVALNHPCPESEDISWHGLYRDAERVMEVNAEHRANGWFGIDWPDDYFVIGDTGCGDSYFIVVGESDKVYLADHEGGPHPTTQLGDCVSSETISAHVEQEMASEREFQEEERLSAERRKNKKWWQFWL